jgi:N-acetylneuraminic acid mutarotase
MSRLLYSLLLTVPFIVQAQNWEQRCPFPGLERDDAVAFSIGLNGYVVTGNHNGFTESNRLWIYHSESNTWSEGSAFPGEPRQYAAVFTHGPFAYMIGGISQNNIPLNDVYRYNSTTDQWIELPDFPGTAHWSSATVSLPQSGFLFGGTNFTTTLKQAWRFEFGSESWLAIDSLQSIGKRDLFAFSIGNDIYLGGGFSINPITFYNEMIVYHSQTDSYQMVQPYPSQGIGYGTACNFEKGGMVVGGNHSDGSLSNEVWYFNGQNWEQKPAFTALGIKGMSSFKIDQTAYFTSGIYETGQRTNELFALKETAQSDHWLKLFPNPSSDGFFIDAPIGTTVEIFDITGKKMIDSVLDYSNDLFISTLNTGIYLLVAKNNAQEILQKIVIL